MLFPSFKNSFKIPDVKILHFPPYFVNILISANSSRIMPGPASIAYFFSWFLVIQIPF